MRVGERGKDEFASGINHFCANATKASDLFVRADGDNFAFSNGQALRPRLLCVDGINFSVNDEDVSGGDASRLLRVSSNDAQKERKEQQGWQRTALGSHETPFGDSSVFRFIFAVRFLRRLRVKTKSERGRSVDPQNPDFRTPRVLPAVRRGAFEIKAVAGFQAIVAAIMQPDFEFAAQDV